jgi:hypothetical protein
MLKLTPALPVFLGLISNARLAYVAAEDSMISEIKLHSLIQIP